jgi:hypothetical protein
MSTWFDEKSNSPMIADQAKRLESFLQAIAGGVVYDAELKSQEERLVKLMKEIEPQLEPKLHGRVTELLCELTAYDMMQVLNTMQQSRPKTIFRG